MSRKKRRLPAKIRRKAKQIGIAALVWIASAIVTITLEHYLPMILGW